MAKGGVKAENEDLAPTRKITWTRSFDYILSLLGMMIGLGNVWRFPYLCYKNGGGAFLIAYFAYVVVLIFPLIILESALGQYTGYSPIKAWGLAPIFKGIGYALTIIMFYCNIFYAMLLAWALRWFVASFSFDMPWTRCDNVWNTNSCLPLIEGPNTCNIVATPPLVTFGEANAALPAATPQQDNTTNYTEMSKVAFSMASNGSKYETSVEQYWRIYILDQTPGIEELGGLKPDLLLCFTIVWIGTYFSIWKGISWTSKVVYVTATLPLVMLIVVTVRGVTLEGADKGLKKYLEPDLASLKNVELWTDAASQVLYSLGACTGGLTALSAYNKFHHNFFRDSIILTLMNAGASFVSGLAIFSVLGFLAHSKNTTVDAVADSGPGLVFMAYPTALSLLPLPQLWCALFFLTLIFLGYDSMFVFQESLISCIKERLSWLFVKKWSSEFWIAVLCIVMYLIGMPQATRGGMYVLNIFNSYSVTGWCLYFISLNELLAIGWVYGADRMLDNIKTMLGFNVPRVWMKICWKFVGPAISSVLLVLSLAAYQPLKYDRGYEYPAWADSIGWFTALNSIICVPIGAIYVVWKAKGNSLSQKFRSAMKPRVFHGQHEIENLKMEGERLNSSDSSEKNLSLA